MEIFTQVFLIGFLMYSLASFTQGVRNRAKPFGLSRFYNLNGSFVWIDNTVFGLFFVLVCAFCLFTSQFILFWLIFSLFWAVRAIGEQIYWFLEQFAVTHRNKPATLWPYRWFKGEETWVVMQIFWQCVSVVAIVSSIYFGYFWVSSL